MIQIETILGFAASNGPLLTICLSLSLAYIVWQRTGSSHLFLSRLWRMFLGKNSHNVVEIQDVIDTQTAVMQFRFITGLRTRTRKRAEAVIMWARQHDEDIGDIAACGPYFDLETPGLKPDKELPKKWSLIVLLILTVILALSFLGSTGAVIYDKAVLRMKQSSTWFTLDEQVAKPISDAPGYYLRRCKESPLTLSSNSGFTRNEVELLCRSHNEGELQGFVDSSISSQRIVFCFAAAYIGYLLMSALRWLRWGVKAHEVKRRLNAPIFDIEEEHF